MSGVEGGNRGKGMSVVERCLLKGGIRCRKVFVVGRHLLWRGFRSLEGRNL